MKNISSISTSIYCLSLFNHQKYQKFNYKVKFLLKSSLIQPYMHKKNLLNFIFFLYLVTNLKPRLSIAKKSNALLNIRKGSLVETFIDIFNFSDLKKLFFIFILEKDLILPLKLKILHRKKVTNTYNITLPVDLTNLELGGLLFPSKFSIDLMITFSMFCKKRHLFLLSTF